MSAEAYRWRCACCGEEYTGLPMDMALHVPVDPEGFDQETRAALRQDEDFCEVRHSSGQVDCLIRCLLPLPVPSTSSEFRFGVWMSISERSWDIYKLGFDGGTYSEEGCFGYLMARGSPFRRLVPSARKRVFPAGKAAPQGVLARGGTSPRYGSA